MPRSCVCAHHYRYVDADVADCSVYRAIVGAVDNKGESILKGREVTGFSNAEEIAVDQVSVRIPSVYFFVYEFVSHSILRNRRPVGYPFPPRR